MIIVMAMAMWGLNKLYDQASGRVVDDDKIAAVQQQCESQMIKARRGHEFAQTTCNCLVGKARDWRYENPRKEYTRDLHERFARQCLQWG